MITSRVTRLLRAPDLQTLHTAIARCSFDGGILSARECAVIVPTRGAAEALRRTLENLRAAGTRGAAIVLPDLLTRSELYAALHRGLPDAPALLSEFEREVIVRRAARVASDAGAPAPFRLRAGLIVEILALYDELRRRDRTVDDFERLITDSLESTAEIDRGAERLLRQTRFLVACFRELERRVAATGRIDEHGLRQLLIAPDGGRGSYAHLVLTIPDQAADPRGLWTADYDLFARMPGVGRIDIVATEALLATGYHQRLHGLFPGLDEERLSSSASLPALVAPEPQPGRDESHAFVSRDREEEVADVARAVKTHPDLDRLGVVFERPLPYLYLARQVLADAQIPYQASDALPLAGEPVAAALDLVFEVALTEATRSAIVELLASPHWSFDVDGRPGPADVAALDAWLHEVKYLGGWERLESFVAEADAAAAAHGRWRKALPALRSAALAAAGIRHAAEAPTASLQVSRLIDLMIRHQRVAGDGEPEGPREVRARAAIRGALASLAAAHAAHDDEPLAITELANTVRRWIEGQTFSPRMGTAGINLLDAPAAAYADLDEVRIVGLVESDWPERTRRSIFYPASLLTHLGWPGELERLSAARARFQDLLRLPRLRVSVSTFTLEDDAIVSPSPLLEEVAGAGLPIVRVPSSTAPRVFVQEALREAPIAPAAASGLQAGWLALRLSRSPESGAAFHGDAGPQPPVAYAVSHVERYLECPFKYFASYVLRLDEERDEEAGLSPRERGQFVHEVFQRFFAAWEEAGGGAITTASLERALALFERVAEAQLAGLPETERALERTYLLGSAAAAGLAERAFLFEIEQGTAVLERLLEHELHGEFHLAGEAGPVRLRIRGKADRIDLLEDGTLRLVDYKLGRAPKPARSLQLPIYGVCAAQALEGRHGRSWTVSRAGYLAFKEKNAFVALAAPAQMAQALVEGQHRMIDAVGAIEGGTFPVAPDEPYRCTWCGYAGVCRKDYVGDE